MDNRYPIYITSKGRWESRLTAKALDAMHVPYFVAVEDYEYKKYASVIDPKQIIVLDKRYQEEFDPCDDLGRSKPLGVGPVRNFCWDHSIAHGHARHWVMDDNIREFYRLCNNMIIRVSDGTMFRCMEDFVDRYENIAIAGPNYRFFAKRKQHIPPVVFNTRLYSCNLLLNSIPFRWRGRYNDDTDISLRVLKAGWCTAQFNAFLQGKLRTQTLKGGCNSDFYQTEGTAPKSKMQVDLHPDVSRLVDRFGRAHHYVDYRPFKRNRLKLKADAPIADAPNEYGMTLQVRENGEARRDAKPLIQNSNRSI